MKPQQKPSSHAKPETRCKYLAKQCERLATFFERDRPSCRVIRLSHDDWKWLQNVGGEIGRANGFVIDEKGISYHGFEIKPPPQSDTKA